VNSLPSSLHIRRSNRCNSSSTSTPRRSPGSQTWLSSRDSSSSRWRLPGSNIKFCINSKALLTVKNRTFTLSISLETTGKYIVKQDFKQLCDVSWCEMSIININQLQLAFSLVDIFTNGFSTFSLMPSEMFYPCMSPTNWSLVG
jgi:hypothetical protein